MTYGKVRRYSTDSLARLADPMQALCAGSFGRWYSAYQSTHISTLLVLEYKTLTHSLVDVNPITILHSKVLQPRMSVVQRLISEKIIDVRIALGPVSSTSRN